MNRTRSALAVCGFALLLAAGGLSESTKEWSHTETFDTRQYCNAVYTTASWDTVMGELRLRPFPISILANDPLIPGYGHHVDVAGNYAYMTCQGYMMSVIDISNPAGFSRVAGYDETNVGALGIAVDGDCAYLACMTYGLYAINISNPLAPTRRGFCSTKHNARDVVVAGNYAFVADADSGLTVVNISNPASPAIAGGRSGIGWADDVELFGDYAFVTTGSGGLKILDVSDPTHPSLAYHYPYSGWVRRVTISGQHAFVGCQDLSFHYFVLIFDISDPLNPLLLHTFEAAGTLGGIHVDGCYLYVADNGYRVLKVYDIRNLLEPRLVTSGSIPYDAPDMALGCKCAFLPSSSLGFTVMRIREDIAPVIASTYDSPGLACQVTAHGSHAYVADGSEGLRVLDISDPENIVSVGGYDTPGSASDVVVRGNVAFVADGESFRVFDVSNPATPLLIGIEYTPAGAIAIAGDHAFVTDPVNGDLNTIDISDPTHPAKIGGYGSLVIPYDVAVSGDCAYVIDPYGTDLVVLDITNPLSPTFKGSYNSSAFARSVAIDGDYAFIGYDTGGFRVFNIQNPAAPTLIGAVSMSKAGEVCVRGDLAFVSNGTNGIVVVNISNPSSPSQIASFDTPGSAYGSCLAGDHLFLADGAAGVHAIQVFQGRFDRTMMFAQSIAIDETEGTIESVSLAPTKTDSIRWEVSADSGAHWTSIQPDGLFHPVSYLGSNLMWRAYLEYRGGSVGPTCSHLYIRFIDDLATLLQGYAAAFRDREGDIEIRWLLNEIDEGVRFIISRLQESLGEYVELQAPGIQRDGLSFTFRDSGVEPGESYRYRIEFEDRDGRHLLLETESISTPPAPLTLYQNYPNPFNPSTTIRYYLPERSSVRLDIYDSAGRIVAHLVEEPKDKGTHTFQWNGLDRRGSPAAAGVYFCRLTAGKSTVSRKLVLLR